MINFEGFPPLIFPQLLLQINAFWVYLAMELTRGPDVLGLFLAFLDRTWGLLISNGVVLLKLT